MALVVGGSSPHAERSTRGSRRRRQWRSMVAPHCTHGLLSWVSHANAKLRMDRGSVLLPARGTLVCLLRGALAPGVAPRTLAITMKYKLIPAALHNFAHSFVSLMNYVDEEYLIDLVPRLLAESPDGKIRIAFPSGHIAPPASYPETLVKSVGYRAASLAAHLESHQTSLAAVGGGLWVVLQAREGSPEGWACSVEATDERGRLHSISVAHA